MAKYGSQNKAAQSLVGISAATVSQLLKGNWDNVSDEMWKMLHRKSVTSRATAGK